MRQMIFSKKLEILYWDRHLIAINKPPGLLVHRSFIARNEKQFALQMLRNQIGQYVFPVHRLDKPTAGVLLFALNPEIAKKIAGMFQANMVIKKYIAIVRGYTTERGTICYDLKNLKNQGRPDQDFLSTTECYSATDFRRLATIEIACAVDKYSTSRYSLVALFPKTGRRHQLRRHMKHIRHPIIGDTKYGNSSHNHFFRDHFNCSCLLLNAVSLKFQHPISGSEIEISSNLSSQFNSVLQQLNWSSYDEPMQI
jgi:tRNA pseudouridine65 synthase